MLYAVGSFQLHSPLAKSVVETGYRRPEKGRSGAANGCGIAGSIRVDNWKTVVNHSWIIGGREWRLCIPYIGAAKVEVDIGWVVGALGFSAWGIVPATVTVNDVQTSCRGKTRFTSCTRLVAYKS
jgi:hypothetical protein